MHKPRLPGVILWLLKRDNDPKEESLPNPTSQSRPWAIESAQIELWSVDSDGIGSSVKSARTLLSTQELDRAQRFRNAIHRQRYVNRHAILRILLSRYMGTAPESISISFGSHGKPLLSGNGLHFNLSHSGSRVCFAFSSISPVGIDLECIRIVPDLLQTADGFCSLKELAELRSLPSGERTLAFLRCWTCKEAIVKALGRGLSYPMNSFSVALDGPRRLLDSTPNNNDLQQLHFHPWEPGAGYVGAVVSRHVNCRIVLRHFDLDWV